MKTSGAAFAAVLAVAPAAQASLYGQSKDNHTCVLVPDYQSCSAKAKPDLVDSCCVETFGGLVLQTQVRVAEMFSMGMARRRDVN
jgi:ribonuclease T2